MITINVSGDRISGSFNSEVYSVPFSQERYDSMMELHSNSLQATTMEDLKAILEEFGKLTVFTVKEQVETASEHLYYNEKTNAYYLKQGSHVSDVQMPSQLVEDFLYAAEKKLPVEPILKFWTRLLRNPNIVDRKDADRWAASVVEYVTRVFTSPSIYDKAIEDGFSEEVATEMATVRQTPFTMEGLVCTKKVVTPLEQLSQKKWVLDAEGNKKQVLRDGVSKAIDEDTGKVTTSIEFSEGWIFEPTIMSTNGDAFHCGDGDKTGHVIRVGQEMWLDRWDQVNCDFNRAGVKGIHTGNQDYIRGYESSGTATLNCFVDPALIGAVACGDDVLRVKALFPHSVKDRETDNKNLYHSSTYAAKNDAEWDEYRAEAVKRWEADLEKLQKEMEAKKAAISEI